MSYPVIRERPVAIVHSLSSTEVRNRAGEATAVWDKIDRSGDLRGEGGVGCSEAGSDCSTASSVVFFTRNTSRGGEGVRWAVQGYAAWYPAPTLPRTIPSLAITTPSFPALDQVHHGSSTIPMDIEKAKQKQVCSPCLNNLTQSLTHY